MNRTCKVYTTVIGRIHGAIVTATGRSDCRGDRRSDCRGDRRRDDRPVYTLQAIVAATIEATIAAIDDRSDQSRRRSPRVYALWLCEESIRF